MELLKKLYQQLKDVHHSSINNITSIKEALIKQIQDAEDMLNCIRVECFKQSNIHENSAIQSLFEAAELLFMEVYSHNLIRVRNLCS